MNCPHCSTTELLISHRHNVEIDYCPSCRGVWLDRGELDKIVERSERFNDYQHEPDDDIEHKRMPSNSYPKRKSFWSELFD